MPNWWEQESFAAPRPRQPWEPPQPTGLTALQPPSYQPSQAPGLAALSPPQPGTLPSVEQLRRYTTPLADAPTLPKPPDTVQPPPQPGLLSDIGNLLKSGYADTARGLNWLAGKVPGLNQVVDAESGQQYWADVAQGAHHGLSTAQQQAGEKKFFNDDGSLGSAWSDPRAYLGTVVESVPGTVMGMGLGGPLTGGLQRAGLAALPRLGTAGAERLAMGAGAIGYGAGEGLIAGGSDAVNARDTVLQRSHEDLQKSSPQYRVLLESMTPDQARAKLADEVANQVGIEAGLTIAATGAPMGAMFGKLFHGSGKLGRTLLGSVGVGAAGEAGQEFVQSGAEQYLQNKAIQQQVDPAQDRWQGVLNQAVSGALAGGIMGGAMAGGGHGTATANTEREAQQAAAKTGQAAEDALATANQARDDLLNADDRVLADSLSQLQALQQAGTLSEAHQARVGAVANDLQAEMERRIQRSATTATGQPGLPGAFDPTLGLDNVPSPTDASANELQRLDELGQWQRQGLQREIQRLNETATRRQETQRLEQAAREGRQRLAPTSPSLSPQSAQGLPSPILEGEWLPPESSRAGLLGLREQRPLSPDFEALPSHQRRAALGHEVDALNQSAPGTARRGLPDGGAHGLPAPPLRPKTSIPLQRGQSIELSPLLGQASNKPIVTPSQQANLAALMGPRPGREPQEIPQLDRLPDIATENIPIAAQRQVEAASPAVDKGVSKKALAWATFPSQFASLNIPRAEMPQIKAEHRGALVNFLKGRGISQQSATVPAASLRPTQAEFSPEKTAAARAFNGGERSILVSQDNRILDGHHQWLAALEQNKPVNIIRLNAPIGQLIEQAKQFPSATASQGATTANRPPQQEITNQPESQYGQQAGQAALNQESSSSKGAVSQQQPTERTHDQPGSWVIVSLKTGDAVFETFSKDMVDKVIRHHASTHKVVPIQEWLGALNQKIAEEDAARRARPQGQQSIQKQTDRQQSAEVAPSTTQQATDSPIPPQSTSPFVDLAQRVKGFITSDNSAALTPSALFGLANQSFGGTQSQGKYSTKDAYDAMELGINLALLEGIRKPELFRQGKPEHLKSFLSALRRLQERLPTQTRRDDEQQAMQQFSTPHLHAQVAAWVANIGATDTVLEPTAGTGNLITHAKLYGPAHIVANELSKRRSELLQVIPDVRVFNENANHLNAVLPADVKPTVVVMNPPFSADINQQGKKKLEVGALHIEQALERLQPNGRLVAIVGRGMAPNAPRFRQWWNKIAAQYQVQANIGISGQEYAKFGTHFDNRILVIDKTAPTGTPVVTGEVTKIEELIPLLEGVRNGRSTTRESTSASTKSQESTASPQEVRAPRDTVSAPASGPSVTADVAERPGRPARRDRSVGGESGVRAARNGNRDGVQQPVSIAGQSNGADAVSNPSAPATAGQLEGQRDDAEPVRQLEIQAAGAMPPVDQQGFGASRFDQYRPSVSIKDAKPHPTPLAESAAMASVPFPVLRYTPALPDAIVSSGKLSDAQIETIAHVGQAHQRILPNGERQGFFIGDGTGVGKGAQIAGIILDNWNQGRKKAVWISENTKLFTDAQRDADWVTLGKEHLFEQGKTKGSIGRKEGVLFSTYATLRSKEQDIDGKPGKSRLEQLVDWLGADFDGVIAFDEAHNMANAVAQKGERGEKKASSAALAGIDLQKQLPKARIVYVSATGATEVSNLAYASRLGLWGEGTAFSSQQAFISSIHAGGLAAMEVVAKDLKAMGLYTARSLSYDGVEVEMLSHALTPTQHEMYNAMARAWQIVLRNLDEAMETAGSKKDARARSAAMSVFWSAHQRFFNAILTSLSVPSLVQDVHAQLAAGHSVVMQLVNTNEATMERRMAQAAASDQALEELDITPRDILMQYLQRSFPTTLHEEYIDEDGNTRTRPVMDSNGDPVQDPKAVALRDQLLMQLASLKVPEGALEQIISHFGSEQVAEITGRKRRLVRQPDGKVVEEKLSPAKSKMDAEEFNQGKRRILVFSDAGGTGRSYHADLRIPNQQRRIHYLVQPGWRADKAIQGLGRTHRTNQKQPPLIRPVTTTLKSQRRFISSIARRMDQMGALTKGQRDANSQGIFDDDANLENSYSKRALDAFFASIAKGAAESATVQDIQQQMGINLIDEKTGQLIESNIPSVQRFLNRLLSLDIETMDKVFDEFDTIRRKNIEYAKQTDAYDGGMETLTAKSLVKQEDKVAVEHANGSTTRYVKMEAEHAIHPVQFDQLDLNGASFAKDKRTGRLYVFEKASPVTNPETGAFIERQRRISPAEMTLVPLTEARDTTKYEPVTFADKRQMRKAWNAEIAASPKTRKETVHLITGTLLPVWDRLPSTKNRVIRAQTDAGEKLIGRVIKNNDLAETLQRLGVGITAPSLKGKAALDAILRDDATLVLANKWRLSRRRVNGEYRVEVLGDLTAGDRKLLEEMGGYSEIIYYQARTFLPNDKAAVIDRLLASKPLLQVTDPQNRYSRAAATTGTTVTQARAQLANALGERQIKALEQAGRLVIHNDDPTKTGAAGFVDRHGVIHLVASNLEQGDALSVALHEAMHVAKDDRFHEGNRAHIRLAHAALRLFGLKNFIGNPSFTGIVQEVYRLAAAGNKTAQQALAKAQAEFEADPNTDVPQELVAYLVQYADEKLPLVRRILSAIRAAMYRMGIKVRLAPVDIRALALSALKAQATGAAIKPSPQTTRAQAAYSQPNARDLTDDQRFEYAVAGLKILASNRDLFKYPISQQKDIAAIAADLSPKIKVSRPDASRQNPLRAFRSFGQSWTVTMPDGTTADVLTSKSGREVYIDASGLEKGQSTGSLLYQLVGQWAYNNGKVFVGDPEGISPAGKARRLEHLISLVLKFGTTDHFMPHPDQNIPWRVGDHGYNLAQMLKASSGFIQELVPDIRRIHYGFGSGTGVGRFIESATGRVVGDDAFERIANRPRARAAQAGATTLKRSVLVDTLLQGAGRTEWRPLLGELARLGSVEQLDPQLQQIFYSQPTSEADAAEQARLWEEFQAVRSQFQAKQASTTAFQRWFGSGVEGITAKDGKPLTLYHGTPNEFYQFDGSRSGINSKHPTAGLGFFMTADKGAAYRYGSHILELHAKIENPYYLTDADLMGVDSIGAASKLRRTLQEQGYDGAVVMGPGISPYVIAFKSQQVKLTSNQNPTDSPDFRFSRPGRPAPSDPLPTETKAQAFQRQVQDKFNRFAVAQTWLKDSGIDLTASADVYGAEALLPKKTAAATETAREKILKPLIQRAAANRWAIGGGQLVDAIADEQPLPTAFKPSITEYLHAQHAKERNAQIAKINPQFPDGGSGLTNAQADQILERYQRMAGFSLFQSLAGEFQAITNQTRDTLLKAGIVSPAMANAWKAAYKSYVPLKGGPEGDAQRSGTGGGISVNGKQKRALGHTLRDENIIENIWRDHERAIYLAQKQEVARALREMLTQANNRHIGTVGQPEKRAVLQQGWYHQVWIDGVPLGAFPSYADAKAAIAQDSQRTGRAVEQYGIRHQAADPSVIYTGKPMLQDNEVALYEDGQLVRLQLNDALLARAARNLGVDAANGLLKAGQAFNRWLSSAYTGYSPEFLVTNPVRDFTAGFINLTGQYGIKTAAKALRQYPSAVRALWRHIRTGSDPLVDQYRQAGGSTGAAYLSDLERIGTDIKTVFQDMQGARATWESGDQMGAVRVAVADKLRLIGQHIENLNKIGENALRVATFQTLLKEGHSEADAARAAGGVTVNFNRKGELTSQLGGLYLFFNPSIQGTKAIWDALAKGPKRHQAQALAGSLVGLAFFLAQTARDDDDDSERRWKALPGYTKDRNMLIPLGDGDHLTIPVPYGYGAFWSLGNILSDVMHGEDATKLGIRLASTLFEQFSPVGNPFAGDEADSRNIVSMLPTALKPAVSLAMNHSELGRPVMPEVQPWNPNRPDSQRMWRATQGSLWERMATGLNAFTGGDRYQAGAIDVSPESLKFIWRTLTGGAGQFAADTVNLSATLLQGAGTETTIREIPFVRKFIRESSIQDARTLFYEQSDQIRAAESMFSAAKRDRNQDAMRSIVQEQRELLALGRLLDAAGKQIKARRQLSDAIERSDLPLAAKRRQLEAVEQQEAAIYGMLNRLFIGADTKKRERKAMAE